MDKQTQQWTAFIFGVSFVVIILLIAILFPTPTPFQYTVFRIVLALAAAGVAAMIPGFVKIELGILGAIITAGGALGVFVIVYFFSPARMFVTPPDESAYNASLKVRNFTLLDKFSDSPKFVSSDEFAALDWTENRDNLTSRLIEQLRNATYPKISFSISSNQLHSSHHVVLWMPGGGVQGLGSLRPVTEIKPNAPLDLTKLFFGGFPGSYFISHDRAELRFRCADRLFETSQLSIVKNSGETRTFPFFPTTLDPIPPFFSGLLQHVIRTQLEAETSYAFLVDGETLNAYSISPRVKVVLLDSFVGQGNSAAEGFAGDLRKAIEFAITKEESLSLSSYSLQQLEDVRTELLKWPFEKPNKGQLIEDYTVDVVLSATITATPK